MTSQKKEKHPGSPASVVWRQGFLREDVFPPLPTGLTPPHPRQKSQKGEGLCGNAGRQQPAQR